MATIATSVRWRDVGERALEEAGVISRYAALLDPERIGLGVRVKVDVRLA